MMRAMRGAFLVGVLGGFVGSGVALWMGSAVSGTTYDHDVLKVRRLHVGEMVLEQDGKDERIYFDFRDGSPLIKFTRDDEVFGAYAIDRWTLRKGVGDGLITAVFADGEPMVSVSKGRGEPMAGIASIRVGEDTGGQLLLTSPKGERGLAVSGDDGYDVVFEGKEKDGA